MIASTVGIAEEQSDGDVVIAFLGGDSLVVETALDCGALVLGDAHGRVTARTVGPVKRQAGRAEIRHHRMALCLDDARAEHALVEGRRALGISRLDCDVVDAWHLWAECPTSR